MRAMRINRKKKECVNASDRPFTMFSHCVYGYNIRNELVSATKNSEYTEYQYQYDDIGNRITSLDLGTNRTYTANNLNQYTSISNFCGSLPSVALAEEGAGEFIPHFDDDMRPRQRRRVARRSEATEPRSGRKRPRNQTLIKTATGIWQVTYNGENRPILWICIQSDNPSITNNETISMSFDRMGRRVTKNNRRFVYDGYLCIGKIEDSTSIHYSLSPIHCFVWDPTEPVATRPLAWLVLRSLGEGGYYTHDGNKNVSEVVTADGGVGAHYEYTPFGALIVESSASSMVNPWRFSSEYSDDMLGLVYYNYRHYEPIMGCWLCRDTLEAATGNINLYQIALSNLIDNFDLLGQTGCKCGPEVGDFLEKTLKRVEDKYNELRKKSLLKAWWICTGIHLSGMWDIEFPPAPYGCAQGECADTVSVHGQCYDKWEVNYILFGKISKLCDICRIQMEAMIAAHKIVMKPIIQTVTSEKYEWEYTHGVREWARIGRDMNEKLPQPIPDVDEKYRSCKPCDKKLGGYRNGFSTVWP